MEVPRPDTRQSDCPYPDIYPRQNSVQGRGWDGERRGGRQRQRNQKEKEEGRVTQGGEEGVREREGWSRE